MVTLESMDSSGGINTRDDPRTLEVTKTQCLDLVNLFPGTSPKPRPGCTFWGRGSSGTDQGRTSGNLVELIPFRRSDDPIVLQVFSDGVRAVSSMGNNSYLVKDLAGLAINGPKDGSKVTYQRVYSSVFANSDDQYWKWIFEDVNGTITARRPTIQRPDFEATISGVAGSQGLLTGGSWYKYGFTLVNRGEGYTTFLNTRTYVPGLLECFEDSKKRVVNYLPVGATANQMLIRWTNITDGYVLDPQVTHLRVYRTDSAMSADTVDGLTLHWVADIPINSSTPSVSFLDNIAVSEGDYPPETTDLDDMPSATVMYFNDGLMWFGGIPGLAKGNCWHSRVFGTTALQPLKSLSFVNLAYDYVRVSSDGTESANAIGMSNGDLYFFTPHSVSYLQSGDPDNSAVKKISSTMGCPFPRTMTEWDQILAWMSPVGPVYAQNGAIDKFLKFTASEVWPYTWNGRGFFYSDSVDKSQVIGFHHMNTWWIVYGKTIIGFYQPDGLPQSAMRIELADPDMMMERVCSLGNGIVVFDSVNRGSWTSGSRIYPYRFLDDRSNTDCGFFMTLTQKVRRLYVQMNDPQKVAEPAILLLFANFTDPGDLLFILTGNGFRWSKKFKYQERPLPAIQQHQDIDHRTNWAYKQPIPAVGKRASWFEATWIKIFRPPYDFTCMGLALKIILRPGIQNDSVSINAGDDLLLDVGMAVIDPFDPGGTT